MEVITPRASLLSNYEVLSLLKELESDHIARSKAAIRIKKEEEAAGVHTHTSHTQALPEISENLRTIQVEAIQYLSADYLPTTRQTPAAITKLVKELASYELTKAEKLQIVNLAPTQPVELYVIVEELEDRLGDRMDSVLELVRSSLLTPPAVNGTTTASVERAVFTSTATSLLQDPSPASMAVTQETWEEDADAVVEGLEFDDHGEGMGVEGDLDVEEE